MKTTIQDIFTVAASISAGVFFGTLGSKIVSIRYKSLWIWCFYIWAIISIILAIIGLFVVSSTASAADYITIISLFIFGVLILIFAKKVLDIKGIYKTSELDSTINKFTTTADKDIIKLFGGDLNFFGATPADMEKNSQYTHLRSLNFHKVLILCEEPRDTTTKIRYGKILHDINGAELRFYLPENADLKIRGRLKTEHGCDRLLIYYRRKQNIYQLIEMNTANIKGALYCNLWNLIWSLAKQLSNEEIENFISLLKR